MSYDNLVVGNSVRLSTYSPSLLGAQFYNLRVEAQMSYASAVKSYPIETKHNAVYSDLPQGTPTDVKLLTFYEFTDIINNQMICLAKEWIRSGTIEIISSTGCRIDIPSAGPLDFERISLALKSIQIEEFSIKPLP